MVLSLGLTVLMIWLHDKLGVLPGKRLPRWAECIWALALFTAVTISICAFCWKLVENTSVMGAPLVAATTVALAASQTGPFYLAIAFLGQRWCLEVLMV